MEKQEILKKYLEKGILLSPQEFDIISKNNKDVAMTITKTKKSVTTNDVRDYKIMKYQSIRNILAQKNNAISINKTKKTNTQITIIGMVKEIKSTGFVAEDTTDEIEVVSKTKPEPEDVIAVSGIIREGKLYSSDIGYPDIPLTRKIAKPKSIYIFTHSDPTKIQEDCATIFTTHKNKSKNTYNITSSPVLVKIKNGINILAFDPKKEISPKEAILYIKKRHLPIKEGVIPEKDIYFIKDIPDLFWLIQDNEWSENYKGMTLFSCGKNQLIKINMETREYEFKQI